MYMVYGKSAIIFYYIENSRKGKVSCASLGNLVQYPMESDVTMHIVMVEPEIPGNTGNIARLCAANHITLHLVKPLGFSLEDKYLKRAGLDYWPLVDVQVHENFAEVQEKYKGHHFYFLTTKSEQCYPGRSLGIWQGNKGAAGKSSETISAAVFPHSHGR